MSATPTIRLPARLTGVKVVGFASAALTSPGGAHDASRHASQPHAPAAPDPAAVAALVAAEKAELIAARDAMRQAVANLAEAERKLIEQTESQLVELALQIASKVLMQEIQAQRYQIDPIVREAMARLSSRGGLVVRLNPQDLARCELAQANKNGAGDSGDSCVRFIADASIPSAHCTVESPEGFVQSEIPSHLQAIAAELKTPPAGGGAP